MSNSNLSNPISASQTNAPQKMAAQRVKAVNELCPPLFDPVGSLAFRPDQHSNSWFLSGYLETATGHKFNCLVHQLVRSSPGQPVEIASILNITDLSRLEYRSEERVHSAGEVTLATDRMQIVTPTSTIEGDHRSVHAQAEFGWGALDFTAEFPGHIMMNGGSGVFNCVDSLPTVQYSIPWGKGSGWITLDGVRHDLTGEFWFDRQWLISRGIMEEGHRALVGSSYKWVWMDLNLSNGIALGLWDIELSGERHGWVTALLQDGTHIIAALEHWPMMPANSGQAQHPVSAIRPALKSMFRLSTACSKSPPSCSTRKSRRLFNPNMRESRISQAPMAESPSPATPS